MINYGWKMRGLWLFNHVIALYSAIVAPQYILPAIIFAILFCAVGSFAGWHRYWSHKSFKTDPLRKTIITWMGVFGCTGKPITIMAGHRLHHQYADQEKDIHSPKDIAWWQNLLGFYKETNYNLKTNLMKDLIQDPQIKFIQRYYFQIIFGTMLVLFLINPILPGYLIGFTALYTFWAGTLFVNHVAHVHGHQDHETGDESRNNWLSALITMGEGWHNNHHNNSLNYTTQNKWYQFDPTGLIIKYILATDLKHERIY